MKTRILIFQFQVIQFKQTFKSFKGMYVGGHQHSYLAQLMLLSPQRTPQALARARAY